MALFDFLKRKEDIEKAKKSEKTEKVSAAIKEQAKKEPKNLPAGRQGKRPEKTETIQVAGTKGFSFKALKSLHVSEKANNLSGQNQYVFQVDNQANKTEIKKAVQGMYKVSVLSVNLVRIPKKKRRLGRVEGFKKGYKMAIVKIKEGQKIETI